VGIFLTAVESKACAMRAVKPLTQVILYAPSPRIKDQLI